MNGEATGAASYGYIIGIEGIGIKEGKALEGGSSKLMSADKEAGTSSPSGLNTFGLISSTGVKSGGISCDTRGCCSLTYSGCKGADDWV